MKGEISVSDQFVKTKRPKSREVSSRFLSNNENATTQSPRNTLSPERRKSRSSNDKQKHKNHEKSEFIHSPWPSSATTSNSSSKNSLFLRRQKSVSERNKESKIAKENHKPVFNSSMSYSGKFKFSRKSSISSDLVDDHDEYISPGRFSVDENALRRKSIGRKSIGSDSESDFNDSYSCTSYYTPVSYMASTASSRQYGIEVSSKYMQDLSSSKSRRQSEDSNSYSYSSDQKSILGDKLSRSSSIKKASVAPKRFDSPPILQQKLNMKPPNNPSKGKGVRNFINRGLELLKGKIVFSSGSSYFGPGMGENVHRLKLLHNGMIQWRYANARAEAANKIIQQQAEGNLLGARNSVIKLQHSVLEKKLRLEKEKLKIKLSLIIHSQISSLESWGEIERQHLSALTTTKDYLQSVVCKVPLADGAKVDPHSTSVALRHASDLASSVMSELSTYSSKAEEEAETLAELAKVVAQEKLLLEECFELFKIISIFGIQERSLKCTLLHEQNRHKNGTSQSKIISS